MVRQETDILLATYNGAAYLADLFASLDGQTVQNWRLIARDDGSTDQTVELLQAWGQDKGDRFILIEDGQKNLGSSRNFGVLFKRSDAAYFLPCDQDDVWMSDKIERLTGHMKSLEADYGATIPLIVHSDLIVTNGNLEILSDSLWRYQRIRMLPEQQPWKLISLQNVVTGCAMIGNRPLLNVALPISEKAMMHDWWLAVVAALFGHIRIETNPTVRYRQHDRNALGAREWSVLEAMRRITDRPAHAYRELINAIERSQAQAGAVRDRFEDQLAQDQKAFLEEYSQLSVSTLYQRKSFPIRHRLFYGDLIRNIGFLGAI